MIKVGEVLSGNVIVEMTPDEWQRAEEYLRFEAREGLEEKDPDARFNGWRNTPAYRILESVPHYYGYEVAQLFYKGQFDGSLEQLAKIAKQEAPFTHVFNLGPVRRRHILEALAQQK